MTSHQQLETVKLAYKKLVEEIKKQEGQYEKEFNETMGSPHKPKQITDITQKYTQKINKLISEGNKYVEKITIYSRMYFYPRKPR